MKRAPLSWPIFSVLVGLAFLAVVAPPLVGIVMAICAPASGAGGLASFGGILSEVRQWKLLGNSIAIAGGTALAATIVGFPAGLALERCRPPGRKIFIALLCLPFLLPPYINAVAWIDIMGKRGLVNMFPRDSALAATLSFNPYSAGGVIAVLSAGYFPIVALAAAVGARRVDRRVEEAARIFAGRGRAFFGVTLPLLLPLALSGSLFVFVLALLAFVVPSLLQVGVYPVEIHARFSAFHELGQGAALPLPLLAIGAAALAPVVYILRKRGGWHKGSGQPPADNIAGPLARSAAFVYLAALSLAVVVLPMAVLLKRSLPLSSLLSAWSLARDEILNSLALSFAAALGLTALGLATALAASERGRGRIFQVSLVLFLFSGPAVGVGMIRFYNSTAPGAAVLDSFAIMVLALMARYAFFAHHGAIAALSAPDPRLAEAARVAGVSWWRRVLFVQTPLAAPLLLGIFGLTFTLSMRELDTIILVNPPGTTTLSIRLFTLMHYGPGQTVTSLCLLTALLIAGGSALVLALAGRAWSTFNAPG